MKTTLYSERIVAGKRAYRFAVKKTRKGKSYLCVTENLSTGFGHELQSVIVSQHGLQAFHEAYTRAVNQFVPRPAAFRVAKVREHYPNAYNLWTPEEDRELADRFNHGAGVNELVTSFKRQPGAILFRLLHLGLIRK